jgi:predicted RNA binding protein YcfA (HicA-like mRNA interferase family)
MPKLPRAPGIEHIKAFQRNGWIIDRIKGSHYILVKEGHEAILSIPVHGSEILDPGTLKGLIKDAGLTNQEYIDLFRKRKRRKL